MKNLQLPAQPCPLFVNISTHELPALLEALRPVPQSYRAGEVLLWAGEETHSLGVVAAGAIRAVKPTAEGGEFPITQMGAGGIFGDVLSASGSEKSPVTVRAAADTQVLWLPYAQILSAPGAPAAAHTQLLKNLVALIAEKYFALDRRIDVLLLRGVREKLLHYFETEALPQPDGSRRIPYTRAGLAAYLGCERSALCRELGRMQRDGLVRVAGRQIFLLRPEQKGAQPRSPF